MYINLYFLTKYPIDAYPVHLIYTTYIFVVEITN